MADAGDAVAEVFLTPDGASGCPNRTWGSPWLYRAARRALANLTVQGRDCWLLCQLSEHHMSHPPELIAYRRIKDR